MSLIKKLNTYSVKADNACLNLSNQAKLKDLQKQFESITNQENNIHSLAKDGIINLVEATNMIAMTNKKKLDIKEKLVATVHVTTDGVPRAISTGPNNQGFYRTKMPDGKHLLSKTREGLLDKLLDYYGVIVGSSSIKDVFEQADEYYITAHNYDLVETGKRHKQDFNRYFSKIKDSDICEWNKDKFNAYIKETVSELQIIESALGKFQAITNIIFGYAFEFGLIKDNWHKTIDWSSFLQYTIYKAKSTDDEAFSDEQIELIWNEIEKRKNHAFRKALNSSDAMQSLTSAQRGALFGHSARVNEEHYTIVKDDKLINSAKKAFGMVETKAKEVRGEDESNLLTPNEPHNIIQFPKRKTLKASRLQGL